MGLRPYWSVLAWWTTGLTLRQTFIILFFGTLLAFGPSTVCGRSALSASGAASWYGESHRGRLMANGRRFDPDKLTAASWFYPLGTKVRVTVNSPAPRSVVVVITDRGPAWDLVRNGRVIDLTRAAFKRVADPERGLVRVAVRAVR